MSVTKDSESVDIQLIYLFLSVLAVLAFIGTYILNSILLAIVGILSIAIMLIYRWASKKDTKSEPKRTEPDQHPETPGVDLE